MVVWCFSLKQLDTKLAEYGGTKCLIADDFDIQIG
jgi:hypothetical protein